MFIVRDETNAGNAQQSPAVFYEGAVGVLRLLLSRLVMVVLENQPINLALYSKSGVAAAERLINFIVRIYRIGFPYSGARDGAMSERAIAHMETSINISYQHRKPFQILISNDRLRMVETCR